MGDESRKWTKFGRYALLEKIGSGGMAEIYRAKTFGAAGFEKEYAIKLIIPSLVDDTEFVEMFINEAKIVVNLYHANIVQVFDLGEIDGQYYIAMEYVHGKDLLDILARCAEKKLKIPLNMVLFITMEMLKGLNFAHTAKDPYGEDLNIIHRDVSPSNILISYAGDVKVGDFGVAKAAAVQRSLTDSDTLKGKVGYMSPEQVMGEEIDSRSDVFSAGIVFFEALSMSRLFIGKSDLDVMLKVRDAEIDEAIDRMRALPSGLEKIIRKALAKDPDDRYQTASDFYQALVDFCYQHSIKVTGNDLSNLMRRLFAEEIEEEKSKRRIETEAPTPDPSEMEEYSIAEESEPSDESDSGFVSPSSPEEVGAQDTERDAISPEPAEMAEADEPDESAEPEEAPDDEQEQPANGGIAVEQTTLDDPDAEYRFKDNEGDVYGPFSGNELLDLIQNRIPHPEDRLAVGDGDWKPITEYDELVDKLPHHPEEYGETRRDTPVGAQILKQSSVSDEDNSLEVGETHDDDDLLTEAAAEADSDEGAADDHEPEEPVPTPDTIADSSLEASVRAMEELSESVAEETSEVEDEEEEISRQHGKSPFERETPAASSSVESLRALETTPDDENVESITALKDQYASYEGSLVETPFPRLLARLHLGNATGRLHVQQNDSVEKSIYVRNGEPVLVDSSKKDELLGSFLLSRGIIDQDQLDQALARLHEWGGRLGDALVAIGAVPAHDIYELLSEQMREKLLDIFSWRDGYYGYYENQEPDTKGYPLGVDALKIIVKGIREHVPFGHLVEFYDNRMTVRIRRRDETPFDVDRLGLTTHELRILNKIDPETSVSELLDTFPSTQKSQVYRIVYLLQQLEIVDFADTDQTPLPEV